MVMALVRTTKMKTKTNTYRVWPEIRIIFCACARDVMTFGDIAPVISRATRPRVTLPLTSNSHRQLVCPPKPTNTAGRVTARCKIEGIFYHQGTQVVEKSFNPTWVGALQFYLYFLDGQPSAVI